MHKDQDTAGVYRILHRPSGRCYIGATTRLAKRWSLALHDLAEGLYENTALQQAYNADGPNSLRCWVEVECPVAELGAQKAAVMARYRPEQLFSQRTQYPSRRDPAAQATLPTS